MFAQALPPGLALYGRDAWFSGFSGDFFHCNRFVGQKTQAGLATDTHLTRSLNFCLYCDSFRCGFSSFRMGSIRSSKAV